MQQYNPTHKLRVRYNGRFTMWNVTIGAAVKDIVSNTTYYTVYPSPYILRKLGIAAIPQVPAYKLRALDRPYEG